MNKKEVEKLFQLDLLEYTNDKTLSNISFLAEFSYYLTGSWSGGAGALKQSVEIGLSSSREAKNALKEYFKQVKDTSDKFNRFIFELYTDGTYKAEYLWDEKLIKKQRLETFVIIPQWLNDKMISLLWELGYGETWTTGFFKFKIQNGEVLFSGYVEDNGIKKNIKEDILQKLSYCGVKDTLLENYELTNSGEIKELWNKSWNTLIINCPHNDLDLKKDVEYLWEELFNPNTTPNQ